MTKQGLGHEIESLAPFKIVLFEKGLFISELCWTFIIWMVKYSILAFYWRLFSTNRRLIRITIWVLAAAVTIWGVAVVGTRSLCQWSLSVGRQWRNSDDRLGNSHSTSMCSCQQNMEPCPERDLPLIQLCNLRGLVDTTCRHRRSALGLSSTINLESSHA